jgi:hypothetical protein
MLMVAMLAVSGVASAGNEGYWKFNDNSGKWNCVGGSFCAGTPGGDTGGEGGAGGAGGNATAGAVAVAGAAALAAVDVNVRNTNVNAQLQGQVQGQQQAAIANGNTLNVAEGAVQNTVTSGNSNATVGDVSATGGNASATGGEGGSAVAAAVVESGAVSVAEGAVQNSNSYTYRVERSAPAIGQGSFAISGCSVAGNAGASSPGGAGFLGFGFTPSQCYDFMLAQAYQSIGEKKAVCDILKNSKAGKRQAKRGITLPECLPEVQEVKTVVVEVPKTVYVEVPPAKISE